MIAQEAGRITVAKPLTPPRKQSLSQASTGCGFKRMALHRSELSAYTWRSERFAVSSWCNPDKKGSRSAGVSSNESDLPLLQESASSLTHHEASNR